MTAGNEVLVEVEGVGKKYCRSLRQSLVYFAKDLSKALTGGDPHHAVLRQDEFFALKDVSFQLRRGECLGVIGHNGAGKSTLLKLLSGVQRPDAGRIRIRGRVGALIELGAGFHPLLTGRENIWLLSSIYGMSKQEASERFDWIVEFSGLSKFLDMPVRSYSSGMVAKLAFSVATSCEPDVLLVDEVLSVGDLAFQSRCLGRVGELLRSGTCVVFISHQLTLVDKISDRILMLSANDSPMLGDKVSVIEAYRHSMLDQGANSDRLDHPSLEVTDVRIFPTHGDAIEPGSAITLEATYRCSEAVEGYLGFGIHRGYGDQIAAVRTDRDGFGLVAFKPGEGTFRLYVDSLPLEPGFYAVSVRIFADSGFEVLLHHRVSYGFVVKGGANVEALVALDHHWAIEHND